MVVKMSEVLMARSSDMGDENNVNPITSVIIVADKNRCPRGFSPITKTYDEQSDADLWRESSFTFFSRPVRYMAISRETPQNTIGTHVVTDLCVVKDSDPIPMGFIAIDYTADSKEKPLRKKYLCVRTVARDAVVDAIGEIVLLSKMRKPPKNYSSAGLLKTFGDFFTQLQILVSKNKSLSLKIILVRRLPDWYYGASVAASKIVDFKSSEVDGILICFKHIVIPSSFGIAIPRSRSTTSVLYPSVGSNEFRHSSPTLDREKKPSLTTNVLTIKTSGKRGVEDVPFKLNPQVESALTRNKLEMLPELKNCDREQLDRDYCYHFTLERAMLSNS